MIIESYTANGSRLQRELTIGGTTFASTLEDRSELAEGAPGWSRWWRSYLRGAQAAFNGPPIGDLSVADLFCGCGGLTLGAQEAFRAVGLRLLARSAVDMNAGALAVYAQNLHPEATLHTDATNAVDFHILGWGDCARFAEPPEALHPSLQAIRGAVDIVVAGPPCEGHSNLNNRTRRADPRNLLYIDTVAIAVALNATAIIIENVPDIINDHSRVVDTAVALLTSAGYATTSAVLATHELGLAQTRRRFFLVGSRLGVIPLPDLNGRFAKEPSTVRWAIEDLVDYAADSVMDSVPTLSAENRSRIDYLFDNDLYELPNKIRPDCHRNGHTYPSVYGRLRWDRPAGTITTGFMSPGRGRFVHPSRKRTITAREAARLQGFPDAFQFRAQPAGMPNKKALAKWIGDAVPPMLGYVALLSVIPGFLRQID